MLPDGLGNCNTDFELCPASRDVGSVMEQFDREHSSGNWSMLSACGATSGR